MDAWNPGQYDKFKTERSQPFWDLAAKVDFSGVATLLDIGCGTGETTAALHAARRIPRTLGIDSSAKMLLETAAFKAPGLVFEQARVEDFRPESKFDVILSNAALQWTDDHETLFPKILNWLAPGAQIAIQMPVNFDHPSHFLAGELAGEWGLRVRRAPVLPSEDYGRMFYRLGLTGIDVSIKVYLHPLASAVQVVEWTKGTLLTYYQKQIAEEEFKKFTAEYTRRLLAALGGEGAYLYPFKRLFLYAINPKTPG